MFFILSKTIDILLLPYTWIIVCALFAVFLKHKRKKQIASAFLLLLLIVPSNTPLVNYLLKKWEIAPKPIEPIPNKCTAIILTGITQLDKKPYDRVYFQKGADRVTQAIMLYRKGKIKNFIITGGSGKLLTEGRAEANALKSFLMDCQIPDSIIITEERAKNTYENALFTKDILEERKGLGTNYILITSAFHMRRSLACFEKAGIHCIPFPVDFYSFDEIDNPLEYVIPEASPLSSFSMLTREVFGYFIYRILGYA